MDLLRGLILKADWQQVESLLKAVASKSSDKFELRAALFHIKRQTYLEMLASTGESLDKNALQKAVQDLQPYCDDVTFNSLCMLLHLIKLSDSP